MVDNSVQCPVCTLYLHAGMNLSDHLETHPKEQVIKALVQMTIVGGGGNNSMGSALAAAMMSGGGGGGGSDGGEASLADDKSAFTLSPPCGDVKPVVATSPPAMSKTISAAMPVVPPAPPLPPLSSANAAPSCTSPSASSSTSSSSNLSNPPMKALKCAPPTTEARANTSAHPTISSVSTQYQPSLVAPDYRFNHQQQQQQSGFGRGVAGTNAATLVIPQVAQQHFLGSHQQQAHFTHQQQQQQQQQQSPLKFTYAALPPPPPLQLFTQQQQQQPTAASTQPHQKPPPAYGAAISQIRSQHNQIKQQPHQQQLQQQSQPPHMAGQHNLTLAPPTPTTEVAGKQPSKAHAEVFLNPPPPPPPPSQAQATVSIHSMGQNHQSHPHLQQQIHQQQLATSPSSRLQQQQSLSLQTYGPVSVSSSCSSSSASNSGSAAASGSRSSRQTNSPFGALLNAAAAVACASPASTNACSSVLRFAESPVAHYLERDNGDFIVQETPKHIVECVEKEDGEFSVIERIYQSPPSVLHIHDDDEDEEDEEEEEEVVDDDREAQPEEEVDGDDERDENSRSRSRNKTTKKSRKAKPKRSSKRVSDEEEEFMSISSGCESDPETERKPESMSTTSTAPPPLCSGPSTSSAAAAAGASTSSNLVDIHSNSASNSASNSTSTTTKSKKNRITVLSDVPLNMNEYLDLMGNIVASSRIGAGRPFAAVVPIPLVKVEKEEPLDEYDDPEAAQQLEQKPSLEHGTTSVIRMASTVTATATSTPVTEEASAEDPNEPPLMKVEVEPNTMLLPQRFSTPAQSRGPKKLVIKPKATASAATTETATKKTDTTPSSSSSSSSSSNPSISRDLGQVQVKSETLEAPAASILEKHLTTSRSQSQHHHSAVNDDDARVLLEFANSKQPPPLAASSTTFVVNASTGFPSAGSVFASSSSSKTPSKPGEEYILPDNTNLDVDEIVISSSSSYASSAAAQVQAALQPPDFNFLYHQTTSTTTAATYPFNAFARQHQQQPPHGVSDATNAATLASSSSNSMDHDSMNASFRVAKTQSLQWYQQEQENDPQIQAEGAGASGVSSNHSHTDVVSHQPTNFNAALAAVDCSSVAATLDEEAKYLDLDTCKREQLSSSSNLPSVSASTSTTSSSFAGAATESSLVGGLNIRTDEKMPAKGEISEQESNCDIENSWSESVYGDISQRFFRNQFSGGYNPDWRQDYYPAQDLSSAQQREHKRFDFNAIDDEASSSSRKSQLTDIVPNVATSSTSTSSALLAGPPIASTSRAAAEAAAEAAAALAQRRPHRRKLYKCPHCDSIFEKLKERNAHMISDHNYVRQNRRLICTQPPVSEPMLPPQQQHAQLLLQTDDAVQEDSKDGIVKIKQEQCLEKPEVEQLHHANSAELLSDVKDSELLGIGGEGDADLDGDIKPPSQLFEKSSSTLPPLAMTTPAAKLAALYRMLIAYNESKLGQERNNLSELEQKAMEKSIFLCYVCRTDFPSVKLYDAHLTEHPAECFTCGKKFYRWKNFSLHLKRHLGWKEFGCYVCDKKFVVRSALVEHMRMHTGQTPLKCKICGKKFKRYSNLTQHRKRHTKVMVRKKEYVCHCGEVLPSKARFLWHKETHDLKPKCCPYCCDRFVHANSLRRHIRLAHSDKFDYAEPMECPMCKQIFAKTSIKAHMATHSTEPQYDCAICNKSFSTKWNLKIHSWVHANRTAKPFKCEYCPKAFVRELDFKNHINAHKQIKPYTCEYCGCKFIRKYNYMRHRREHHGTKKFTCDQCDKSFHRHYYLIEHRRMHTGERPFTCTICGKSSTTKTNHNKHLKIHHSRDPFTVEV
ncbi:uncharacterized protein [Drosophila kikkawai]|uniref:Uncharacterized protein LOC108083927 n=1 Tax=Drosophila kikkawai TaxID=30033 RepID=A0A6P4JL97_DROKI|nr:uncharacterized protein LOC108083927 [Drosophila kikkawai]XP_017035416.1 uncharacterized protein LOC108083927 [Drosophila kikkawai]XP_017035417.1 uncharacterized protein LOC108083927 [Drosophila kikkawai]